VPGWVFVVLVVTATWLMLRVWVARWQRADRRAQRELMRRLRERDDDR
jgi:hypothetical protein